MFRKLGLWHLRKSLYFRKERDCCSGQAKLWGPGDVPVPPAAWGSLVRTTLHLEPFSLSAKRVGVVCVLGGAGAEAIAALMGGPEAIAAFMFSDSPDGLSVCVIGIF